MKSYITTGSVATRRVPNSPSMDPEIGEELEFVPHALWMQDIDNTCRSFARVNDVYVRGVCCYVNRKARWARYEYEQPGGGKAWECFKY